MLSISGYTIIQTLHSGSDSLVLQAQRKSDNQPVMIKMLRKEYPTPEELARFRKEYEMTHQFSDMPGVIQVYHLEEYENTLIMILEDFDGRAISHLLLQERLTLEQLLSLAISMVDALHQVHQKQFIHKDINPSNIVWNPQTQQVKIIDFGLSTEFSQKQPSLPHTGIDGTLAYMSPEQTGRMNQTIDYRTDLYSLGVTFYQMFTEELPFTTKDTMELMHAHIAKIPRFPNEINPDLPEVLSQIIMKLLSKNPEERYQSTFVLQSDLQKCLDQLLSQGTVENFAIAQTDLSDQFQIPNKLYGREKEIEQLQQTFVRVSEGASELVLLNGYSGMGKSALVHEVRPEMIAKEGHFIQGKFDQLKRDIPYSSFIQAFQEFVRQILSKSEAEIQNWKTSLSEALGSNGEMITKMIPEMEWILDKQHEVGEISPLELKNHFYLVFQDFVKACATADHPLVIFLDDLQWADSSSLELLELFVTDSQIKYLLLIGSYRDNEVDASHSLMLTLKNFENYGTQIHSLTLNPLSLENINELLAETLLCKKEVSLALAELCLQKTLGNPFFLKQFLMSLYEADWIYWDKKQKRWCWDIVEIEAQEITDNVVELMSRKMQTFSESTQYVLAFASCIGNLFDLYTLSLLNGQSPQHTVEELDEAVEAGFLIPLSGNDQFVNLSGEHSASRIQYQFLHDRVQQAAYSLIPDTEKQILHLQIGRLLLEATNEDLIKDSIFEILQQFNRALEQVENVEEQYKIAHLNLLAAQKAKSSTAYESGLHYLNLGLSLVSEETWETNYQLMLQLHQTYAEYQYMMGDLEASEQHFRLLLQYVKMDFERIHIYYLMLRLFATSGKNQEALDLGRTALGLMGIEYPQTIGEVENATEIKRAKQLQRERTIAQLSDLPLMSSPHYFLMIKIYSILTPSAYFIDPHLFCFFSLRAVNLSLEHGNSQYSSYSYGLYAAILAGRFGKYQQALEFGELSIRLSERFENITMKARSYFLFGTFVNSWRNPLHTNLQYLKKSLDYSIVVGDLLYSYNSYIHSHYTRIFMGESLDEVYTYTQNAINFIRKGSNFKTLEILEITKKMIHAMQGKTFHPCVFDPKAENDEALIATLQKKKAKLPLLIYGIYQMRNCFLFEQSEEAWKFSQSSQEILSTSFGLQWIVEYHFYQSLIALSLYQEAEEEERNQYHLVIQENFKKFENWTKTCEENFRHKYLLIAAEMARLTESHAEAMHLYNQAIDSAHVNKFIQCEALANELATQYYLLQGKAKIAKIYLMEARYGYLKWGATAKIKQLDQKYSHFFTQRNQSTQHLTSVSSGSIEQHPLDSTNLVSTRSIGLSTLNYTQTTNRTNQTFDFFSVMKASQAISEEIVLETLLQKMIKVMIENAGAQKGIILLPQKKQWFIQAQGSIDQSEVTVLQAIPITAISPQNNLLSVAIVRYVEKTQEPLVLADASHQGWFTKDAYTLQNQPKSVLCLPILHQGHIKGILYLENNVTTGAFTADRLEVLHLLSSQTATSLENAQLYSQLNATNMAYKRFVPYQFLEHIGRKNIVDVKLGDQSQEIMSILFADIRSFTTLSENMSPQETFDFINSYLEHMEPIILGNKGFIDKYIGDAILALFANADDALQTSLEMMEELERYNQGRKQAGYIPIQIGIGINTGPLTLGIVGSNNRMEATVIGDAVNLGARVESLTKHYETSIVISHHTFEHLQEVDKYQIHELEKIQVKGKKEWVMIYGVCLPKEKGHLKV